MTFGDRGQVTLALRVAAAERHGEPGERVAHEGARQTALADHLLGEREIEQLETGAAVRLVDHETREPHLDEPLPEVGLVAVSPIEDLAQPRRRALVVEIAPDGVLEHLLLFTEAEVHGTGSPLISRWLGTGTATAHAT